MGDKEDGREEKQFRESVKCGYNFQESERGVEINGLWEIEKEEDHADCCPTK